jgi:hypothetical protein
MVRHVVSAAGDVLEKVGAFIRGVGTSIKEHVADKEASFPETLARVARDVVSRARKLGSELRSTLASLNETLAVEFSRLRERIIEILSEDELVDVSQHVVEAEEQEFE